MTTTQQGALNQLTTLTTQFQLIYSNFDEMEKIKIDASEIPGNLQVWSFKVFKVFFEADKTEVLQLDSRLSWKLR